MTEFSAMGAAPTTKVQTMLYTLDRLDNPVPVDDNAVWGEWMANNYTKRIVRQERVFGVWVSTVFLGMDHSFGRNSVPLVFETMAFGGTSTWLETHQQRCGSMAGALEQHRLCVRDVRQDLLRHPLAFAWRHVRRAGLGTLRATAGRFFQPLRNVLNHKPAAADKINFDAKDD
jgi:hypothetical protein